MDDVIASVTDSNGAIDPAQEFNVEVNGQMFTLRDFFAAYMDAVDLIFTDDENNAVPPYETAFGIILALKGIGSDSMQAKVQNACAEQLRNHSQTQDL